MNNELNTELFRAIKSIDFKKIGDDDKIELLSIFRNTKNAAIRDQIALFFAEIHYNEAVPFIIKKINEKGLYNHNGTLVYSLENLDTLKYFIELIKIICEQAYEARLMAYEIIEELSNSISNQTRRRSLQILESYLLKERAVANDKYENSTLHFIESAI
jgi:hypothetical protein